MRLPTWLNLFTWMSLLMLAVAVLPARAQDAPFETFGEYKIYYSVFNSSFIKPDIAQTYNITRGKDQVLVNISVVKSGAGGDSGGIAATVSGTAANLMQQQKTLEFKEIKERNAVYYLAPLRIHNEEVLTFNVAVKASGSPRPFNLEFRKTLYVDQ